jgi:carboxylesterase type B
MGATKYPSLRWRPLSSHGYRRVCWSRIDHASYHFVWRKRTVPFQQAIPQSPAFQLFVPAQSRAFFSQVVGNASTLANTTITSAQQLRTLPYEILYELNAIIVGLSTYGSFTFGPVVDPSPGAYVPDFPARLISQGKFHNVNLTVGHNTNEGLLFSPPFIQTQAEFVEAIQALFPTANASTVSFITNVLYPPVFNGTYGYTNAIGRTALLISNFLVTCNANILASTLKSGYAYVFSVPPGLHGEDVPYTFFNGDSSTSDEGLPVNASVAGVFQKYLTNFVVTGKPTALGSQDFTIYGQQDTVTNIGLTALGAQIKDPGAVPACQFWQEAPFYTAGVVPTSNGASTSIGGNSPSSTSSGALATPTKNAGVAMRSGIGGLICGLGSIAYLVL